MINLVTRAILLATAFALAGCGGGGGGSTIASVGSTPPPATPPPPPPPAPPSTPTPATSYLIIPAAKTDQQFAAVGAAVVRNDIQVPRLDADSQLQVRYVASSNLYEVQLPQGQNWGGISVIPVQGLAPVNLAGNGAHLWMHSSGYAYSSLFEWADDNAVFGHEAIGMATPASGIPITGSASYSGQLLGFTTEYQARLADDFALDGSIQFSFDFGHGSLSGSISPNLHQGFDFAPLNFRDTVYSTGSTTFSGRFDTNVAGVNSFSGLFTGPNAQELIGNFAFPYRSPIDSQVYQASGAFVAK